MNASNQALTLQEQGRLLGAREQLLQCVVATCPQLVREDCEQQLNSVRAAIPTVVFQIKDQQGEDLDGVTITLDGEALKLNVEGTPVELDPGKHQVRFERAGCAPVERTIIVAQGEHDRRERVVLTRLDGAAAPGSQAGAPNGDATPAAGTRALGRSAPDPARNHSASLATTDDGWAPRGPLATAGLVSAGVGVLSLGASGVLALLARSKRDEARGYTCDSSGDCGKGPELWSDAKSHAKLATGLLIGGGVLTAAGLSLYFVGNGGSETAEPAVALTPEVNYSGAALNLQGRF